MFERWKEIRSIKKTIKRWEQERDARVRDLRQALDGRTWREAWPDIPQDIDDGMIIQYQTLIDVVQENADWHIALAKQMKRKI